MTIYDIKVKTIDLKEIDLSQFKEKVILIVNTASTCGFTPQYESLEKIFKKYKDKGFEILAFPCNQFNQQEKGNEEEIKNFCRLKYDISFPLFAKIEVKGKNQHPLFKYLTENKPGLFGSKEVKWNFTKFLLDRKGRIIKRYAPATDPLSIQKDIEKLI